MKKYHYLIIIAAIILAGALWWLSAKLTFAMENSAPEKHGPHNGRLFEGKDFTVELVLTEEGATPKFKAYVSSKGKPISPSKVNLIVELKRLEGDITTINFIPQTDTLVSKQDIEEPHSFDVTIKAVYENQPFSWNYSSYEGRIKLSTKEAEEEGVTVLVAGPGEIKKYAHLNGRITLNRNTTTDVRARFPGIVKSVLVKWGDSVKKGDLLATIESNESLKEYEVRAPTEGRILARNITPGNVAGTESLFTIANLSDVWAELHVFPRDLEKINKGQMVTIHSQEEDKEISAPIAMILPTTDPLSQTVIAIVTIPNSKEEWRPGTIVRADVLLSEIKVPLMVKTTALQNMNEKTVLFIKVGEQYEMREVELGVKDNEWVEVKSGLKPGTQYVVGNSFLIKADIEKSGAEHEH
ncbi:efflux RND transporter periplasmic adaptor subunit [Legionella oakridgensis]|uniref:Membrane-fusion protein n=1 Tax=Legionella oakridgensis ATCC 33761 = DSM 21215 TaxID=1268635 RepID=W0BJD2_9GAMM|nr:efflux RND transporter periplasmic adaptor subunit [Legionella oakridgensis]AHE68519.1 membrane-fusion protein [Legionella oakridgensis ATCC 33761 = DSM 21215]STY41409.1 HelB protein [Legionella longbeachae]